MMKTPSICMAMVLLLAIGATAQDYDFFYFVLQWPGSYCDTRQGCCYPTSGKPAADFGIHGLWPNRNDGSYPQDCDSSNSFDESKVSHLLDSLKASWPTLACPSNSGTKFWRHEWEKHGTCAEDVFDEASYFQTALGFKAKLDILPILQAAGINPDGASYGVGSIKDAIAQGTGFTPYIQCNRDASRTTQLDSIYFCVDKSGRNLIECPAFPHGRSCGSEIEFPSFDDDSSSSRGVRSGRDDEL